MLQTVLRARQRTGALAAVLIAALVLASCGDDDSSSDAPAQSGDEATAPGPSTDEADTSDTGGTAAATSGLTTEDGWLEVHDLDIPGPGEGTLSIDGQNIDLEVTCGTGMFGVADWVLFGFIGNGVGVDADGREVTVSVERRIISDEEAASSFYGLQEHGMVQVSVNTQDGFGNSVLVSPDDDDTDGAGLPIVHINESGAFTVVETVEALPFAPDPLEGPLELAGQCQAGWQD